MDDFNITTLQESKNEIEIRVLDMLTPKIFEGFRTIFQEALKICKDSGELSKYLKTFQNLMNRIPKWNSEIINKETKRIKSETQCEHLEELISCLYIIKTKSLTACRVGQTAKKIDIDIPNLNNFIHNVYINSARQLYSKVYLFQINLNPKKPDITSLKIQEHNYEIEKIIREAILRTIRESIPVSNILRAYIDKTNEEDIIEEIKEEVIEEQPNHFTPKPSIIPSSDDISEEPTIKLPSLTLEDITSNESGHHIENNEELGLKRDIINQQHQESQISNSDNEEPGSLTILDTDSEFGIDLSDEIEELE